MIDPEKTNDYFLKLGGKGNIPSELEIGRNYELKAQGTIVSLIESDKDDGTHSVSYNFKPILIEIVNDKGEAIKAKDTRSLSQLFRARAWKEWSKTAEGLSFEDFYERLMSRLIMQAEEVIELYGNLSK